MYQGAGRPPPAQEIDPNDPTYTYNQPMYYDEGEDDIGNYMEYDEEGPLPEDLNDELALDTPPGEQMRLRHFQNVFNTSTVMPGASGPQPPPPPPQPQQQHQHPQQRHPSQPVLQPDYTYTYHQTHLAPDASRRLRTRHREDRLSALSVLLDRELLMLQALGTNETLPQARRRFMCKIMAPEDPADAAAIRADRYTVFIRSNAVSGSHVTVPRSVVDVHETGDEGWGQGQDKGAASPSPLGVSKRGSRMSGQHGQGQGQGQGQRSTSGRVVSGSPSQASRRRSGVGR